MKNYKQSNVRQSVALMLALIALSSAAGCYSRTVESNGLGTQWEQRDIYKPNLKKNQPKPAAKPKRSGGLFNNIGEFFFGSDDNG